MAEFGAHGVEAHADRRGVVKQRRDGRHQNAREAARKERRVEAHGNADVAADALHRGFAEVKGDEQVFERRRHDDVRHLLRDVRAVAHRHADIGRAQRGTVVDAVADHQDLRARVLETQDFVGLVGRKHLSAPGVDAEACRDGRSRALIVTREHDDLLAAGVQCLDDAFSLIADRILDAEHADEAARKRDVENGLALRGQTLDVGACGFAAHAFVVLDEVARTQQHGLAVDLRADAVGDDVLHLGVVLLVMVCKPLLFGRVHDGARDGMREVLLKTGGERQQLVLGHVLREGDHVGEVRSGVGERARLVEDDGLEPGEDLMEERRASGGARRSAQL